MKAPKKSEADNKSAAQPRASAKTATVRKTSAPAAKEENASREVKHGSPVKTGSKAESLERKEPENVTPVGKETPLSTKSRKDASKGNREEKKTSKGKKTQVVSNVNVGFGNSLFIRGSGAGLSWDQGLEMRCTGDDQWSWESDKADGAIEFKLLINDQTWSQGENFTVQPGERQVINPSF